MKRGRHNNSTTSSKRKRVDPGRAERPARRVTSLKLWCFRLLSAVLAPVVCLGLLEAGLRLAGSGYPTSFLLPSTHDAQKTFIQNSQFGWRFFGRQMARLPHPISIPQVKPPGTVRIFVFGESAAYGDPQPRFGLPRMLEAMLSLRHPGVRFEVVNAAMTAINSHTILPIARDCAGANGDIWVIYMGNNEVVGPYGAGTVFGPQVPPLPLIRASLALKSTRTGQCLDSLRERFRPPPPEKSEWGGMVMFLDQQLRADEPRMTSVYHHFERNLADIIQAGRQCGAGIVVSSVAVNLRDCAPFASAHRPDLTQEQLARWRQAFASGATAQAAGNLPEAARRFQEAAQIDDRFAELRFRRGQCLLALGEVAAAQREFSAARDLDTLRFRCDGRLNEITRQAAVNREPEHILLADAERAFAEASPHGLPGQDFFYEHVHLTFEGNYLLARTIAAQVERLLPEQPAASRSANGDWPSIADCAKRLAWSEWSLQESLSELVNRLSDPPFTAQFNHDAQMRKIIERLDQLQPATQPAGVNAARGGCEVAVAAVPDDPFLHAQLAALRRLTGDFGGAAQSARRAVELLPSDADGWQQLGSILVQAQQYEEAASASRRAFELDSQNVWALQDLAQCYLKLNRREDAAREYERALRVKPRFGLAWLGLGQLREEQGRKSEAEECYRKALANRIHRAAELTLLARFCRSRGWHEAAATNYLDAFKLAPSDARLCLEAAQTFSTLGRRAEAAQLHAEAVRLAPNLAQARFLHGQDLGQAGHPDEAAAQFREALRLMPELLEARINLGVALINGGKLAEALEQFAEVLRRSPTNAVALQNMQALRAKLGAGPSP